MNDTLAGASPVDKPVRPLSARLDVLRVLLAERHPEHHAAVAEAQAEIERLRDALTTAQYRGMVDECISYKGYSYGMRSMAGIRDLRRAIERDGNY